MDRLLAKAILTGFFIILLSGIPPLKAQNLTEVYDLAVLSDPTLMKAEAERLASKETRNQSLALFFPAIEAAASSRKLAQTQTKASLNRFYPGYQNYWMNLLTVQLTQPIFHWDYWVQLSQSDNQIAQAEASYHAEQQNLMLRTTEAYFNVLAAEDTLSYAEAEKEAIGRQLERAKGRFEVGIIPVTDVNEAQAGYDQAESAEIEASNFVNDQKEALREIIGDRDIELDALGERLPLLKPEPQDINAWSSLADENNFNIISALNQAEYARKNIDLQLNGHMPKFNIVAAYQKMDNTNVFGIRGDIKTIGLEVNIPLFEGGGVISKTRQAQYEYEAAKDNLIAVRRSIKRQIKDTYRSVMTNISRVHALKTTVASLETALEASEAGLDVGTRTMVDVLLVQRDLYRNKRDYSRARYDYLINSIRLKQLTSNLLPYDLEQINQLLLTRPPVITPEPIKINP